MKPPTVHKYQGDDPNATTEAVAEAVARVQNVPFVGAKQRRIADAVLAVPRVAAALKLCAFVIDSRRPNWIVNEYERGFNACMAELRVIAGINDTKCRTVDTSSRMCGKGTKSCVVHHGEERS